MKCNKLYLLIFGFLMSFMFLFTHNRDAEAQKQETVHTLRNETMILGVDLYGGAFVDIHLGDPKSVNPLTWKLSSSEMPANNRDGAPFRGHFLCLGRWGSPTKGEIKQGVPHNGQASNIMWKIEEESGSRMLVMSNKAPLDGMKVKRMMQLDKKRPVFYVTEKVTNTTTVGRLNNVVQHVTLGPPFLDEKMRINCNAREGFLQEFSFPDPEKYSFCWPFARVDEEDLNLDLRKTHTGENYVSTHLVGDTLGWVIALNPDKNLVIGYIWNTNEYPWLNIWNQTRNGRPVAKGLEFGTTGIGKPYTQLLEKETFFHGVPSWEFLDAGETAVKSFTGFITRVPPGFKNVERVIKQGDTIALIDKKGRKVVVD
jgi:hypothetical protein